MVCRNMACDIPTGSVTGQHDWEWNRWQSAENPDVEDELLTSRPPKREPPARPRELPDRASALRLENRALRAELERQKRHRQYVIEHYERLLTEQNRQIAEQTGDTEERNRTPSILSDIYHWITDR